MVPTDVFVHTLRGCRVPGWNRDGPFGVFASVGTPSLLRSPVYHPWYTRGPLETGRLGLGRGLTTVDGSEDGRSTRLTVVLSPTLFHRRGREVSLQLVSRTQRTWERQTVLVPGFPRGTTYRSPVTIHKWCGKE